MSLRNLNYDEPQSNLILSNINFFQLRGMSETAFWLSSFLPIDPTKPTNDNNVKNQVYQPTIDVDYQGALQLLIQAKLFYEKGQYKNCAKIFEDIYDEKLSQVLSRSSHAVFLKSYSNLFAYKIATSDERAHLTHINPLSITSNYVDYLSTIMNDIFSSDCEIDSPLYWLIGLICKDLYKKNEARCFFLEAIKCNPLNGSAWLDLINLIWPTHIQNLHTNIENLIENNEIQNIDAHKEENNFFTDNPLENASENLQFSSYEEFIEKLKLPNSWTSEIGYGLYCMKSCRYIKAVHLYEKFLLQHQWHCPHIYTQLAKCGFELNRFEFSAKMFKKLHTMKPLRLDYVEDYATLLCSEKKFDEISRLARLCYETSPNQPSTCVVIGKYCSFLSDIHHAIYWYEKALQFEQFYLPSLICLADLHIKQNHIDLAVQLLYKANEIHTHNTEVYNGLGQALMLKKDYQLSLYYLEMACFYRPDNFKYWDSLGDVQIALNMFEQAIQSYQQAWIHGKQLESLCKIFTFLKLLLNTKNAGDTHKLAEWAQLLFEHYVDTEKSKISKTGESIYRKGHLNDENYIEEIIRFGPKELREAITYLMKYNCGIKNKAKALKFAKLAQATESKETADTLF